MKRKTSLLVGSAGLLACTAILVTLTGCFTEGSGRRTGYQGRMSGQVMVSYQDDYDYYPGYEVYYSRNRREYVYRDGNQWVRRSEPRGIPASVLLSTPSVRVDFHDSPEQHHAAVVRSYPRDWKRRDNKQDDSRKDAKKDRKDDDRDDVKDDRRRD